MTKRINKQSEPTKYIVSLLVGDKETKKSFPDFATSQKYMDARVKELEPNGVREPNRVKFWVLQSEISPNYIGCESVKILMNYTNDYDWWKESIRKRTFPRLQSVYNCNADPDIWGDNYFKGSFEEWLQSDYGKEMAQSLTFTEEMNFADL